MVALLDSQTQCFHHGLQRRILPAVSHRRSCANAILPQGPGMAVNPEDFCCPYLTHSHNSSVTDNGILSSLLV